MIQLNPWVEPWVRNLESASFFVIPTLLLSLVYIVVNGRGSDQFRRVGQPWLRQLLPGGKLMIFHAHEYARQGYEQISKPFQAPFVMKWWSKDYLLLPPKYLEDLKRADPRQLSFFLNISDAFNLHHSVGDLYSSDLMADIVRRKLNKQLTSLIIELKDECDYAFDQELGESKDWEEHNLSKLCERIMLRTTSRILAGKELCRSRQYLKTSQVFTDSIMINALLVTFLPLGPFREMGSRLLSYFHRRNLSKAMELVLPVVKSRLAMRKIYNEELHNDTIQWAIELQESEGLEPDAETIALSVLHNLWAGSAAPAGLVAQMVTQVLMEPEYLQPLIHEAQIVTSERGWTEKALNEMFLMDSFIRELCRLYPAGSITIARTIIDSPWKLHDGLELPVSTRIAFPAMAQMHDDENFPDALKFDGWRFYKLNDAQKEDPEELERRWSASTPSKTYLPFGYGKHACPGRFYAIRKAKLIFSKLILDYDFSWLTETTNRPPNLSVNGQFAPNQEAKILVRPKATNI